MSFQQGLSGLNAASKHLDTIGNNVANASTVGFKQSQIQFSDMFAVSLQGSGAVQIGSGTMVAAVAQQFTQGNITATTNPMDTAISGQGFFRMVDAAGAVMYSRNGQFQVDKNGFMTNNQGHTLSGYLPNPVTGVMVTTPVPLKIDPTDMAPKQTANSVVGVNLNSAAPLPITTGFNPADPTSYTNSTSMSVYDSLGASHVGTMYFQRQAVAIPAASVGAIALATPTTVALTSSLSGLAIGNTITIPGAVAPVAPSIIPTALTATITGITPAVAPAVGGTLTFTPAITTAVAAGAAITTNAPSSSWNTFLMVDNTLVPPALAPVAPAAVGLATPLATLNFSTIGALQSVTSYAAPVPPLAGVANAPVPVVVSPTGVITGATILSSAFTPVSTLVTASQTIKFDFATATQFGGAFGVNTLTQDGYASGRLNATSTGADGIITGRYSNGQSRPLGQIALVSFTSPQGLQPVGNNEWVETGASGSALVGAPGTGRRGVLQSSATEDSNADLTAELVNMITAQRVYQANAQTIKTQDQLLQTIVTMR